MLGILYLSLLWVICSGQRQHLDAGPQDVAASSNTEPAEPGWVTALRLNIRNVISNKGIQNAKPDIKDMIANTHKLLNRQKYDFTDYSKLIPEGLEQEMGSIPGPSSYEPLWEQRLKKFVKALIKTKGKKGLDQYVNPIVKSIEKQNNVEILDIDVNPYGEVSVKWNQKSLPPFSLLGPHANEREGVYRKTYFL